MNENSIDLPISTQRASSVHGYHLPHPRRTHRPYSSLPCSGKVTFVSVVYMLTDGRVSLSQHLEMFAAVGLNPGFGWGQAWLSGRFCLSVGVSRVVLAKAVAPPRSSCIHPVPFR
jgi:hypothetical protein